MSTESARPNSIESALAELSAAESAGVFSQTPVDVTVLVNAGAEPTPILLRLRPAHWLSAAAVFLLAMGVWSMMFHRELSDIRSQRAYIAALVQAADYGAFHRCIQGPVGSLVNPCDDHDYDADGDVDLADFRRFQIAYATH